MQKTVMISTGTDTLTLTCDSTELMKHHTGEMVLRLKMVIMKDALRPISEMFIPFDRVIFWS